MQYSNLNDITESSHDHDEVDERSSQKIESQGEQETTLNSDPMKCTKSKHQCLEVSVCM